MCVVCVCGCLFWVEGYRGGVLQLIKGRQVYEIRTQSTKSEEKKILSVVFSEEVLLVSQTYLKYRCQVSKLSKSMTVISKV